MGIRRKVLPVAIAYAIGGWVLLQIGDVLIGLLELPGWWGRVIVALVPDFWGQSKNSAFRRGSAPGDYEIAGQLLAKARSISDAIGMHGVVRRIDEFAQRIT